MSSGAGYSNVGNKSVYEAGDQRNYKQSELNDAARYHEGKPNSHLSQDSKDQRTIANRLGNVEREDHTSSSPSSAPHRTQEYEQLQQDATLPARSHGNAPSRGAEIDQQLREEEERELRSKGRK